MPLPRGWHYCRYYADRTEVIGFSNMWYPEGFKQAIAVQLDDQEVRIFSLPYFIASKLEAFKSRGKKDYRFSSDFEDIVYVLENNGDAQNLLADAPATVRDYLKKEFAILLDDKNLEEGLYAHLEPATAPQQIVAISELLQKIAGI